MRVAINGAGIAGPTLAYWLRRFGPEGKFETPLGCHVAAFRLRGSFGPFLREPIDRRLAA